MSAKLDLPLEDIVKSQRGARRGPGRPGRVAKSSATTARGVIKSSRINKAVKATSGKGTAAIASIPNTGESKIVVSGLPTDVSEQQIKDYFSKTIGAVKRIMLTYGPTGQSKGMATITFVKSGGAMEAAKQLDGVKVDNRAMKVEVIVGANQTAPIKAKALSDRIAKPKTITKSQGKGTKNATARAANGKGRGVKKGRATGRGKPKNAQELDAEMTDYFDGGANGATTGEANPAINGAAQPVTNGGDAMEDEIM